jgi:hypothetical protein
MLYTIPRALARNGAPAHPVLIAHMDGRRRILVLVVSFFNLLHVPLGTLLGVYSLWVLLNDETIRQFNPVMNMPLQKTTTNPPV